MLRQKEVLDRDETGMIFNVDTTTTTNRQPANVRHNPLKKRELRTEGERGLLCCVAWAAATEEELQKQKRENGKYRAEK